MNCSISLLLAYGILHYHDYFIDLSLIVSHHVHHWFIRLITSVPDYSSVLKNSYDLKICLCYIYLIFGYMGFSSQIILTVDLIYLLNLPTIFIYKLLAKCYQYLKRYINIIINILKIKK